MKLRKLFIFIAFLVHTISCQKEGSLTFVIDNTNSMRTDIKYVRGGVDKIMDVILEKKSSQIEDIILVRFNDPDYEKLITTRDRYDLKKALNNLRTWSDYHYNRECPEMALSGVKLGLESSKDNSHMFVFADSSPKDFKLTNEVIRLAQKKSSQIVFILTEGNHCGERSEMFNPYYAIAKATFGQVLRIKAKTEIGKVIDYIAETCSGERTVLVQIDIPERENRRVSFDIDDQTEYVIISASGKHVALDWSEMVLNFNVRVKKITWLDHFKAVKLIAPERGRYSVKVWGKSETSVVVYGRTNFKFHYGFSLSPVQSLMDTVKNPTAGEKHQLAISVNDPDQAVFVDTVELLDMHENVLKNLSLNRESPDFYTTKLFLPPISTFLIAVLGRGKYTHKPVRRISKTPIEPKMKDFEPIITFDQIKDTYEYNSKLYLNCNVKGYPRPYVTCTDENSNILRNTTLRNNPPYEYSYHLTVEKLKKSQRYTCHAENKFGKRSKNVFVHVDSPFVVNKHLEDVTTVSIEKEVELICDIKSKWPMKITWWRNGELVTSHVSNDGTKLVVNKANIKDQDTYICKAELLEDGLTRAYQTMLKIKGLEPIVTVDQIKKTYEYNSMLYLHCNVKGYPKPQTIWTDENGTSLKNTILKRNTLYDYSYHGTVKKLKKSQSYTCYAENKFGKNSINVYVNVDSPFVVTKHLEDVTTVSFEKEVELICDIKSKWPMKITWWRNGELVTSHVSNDGTKLVVNKANIKDQDTYICKAELLEDGLTRAYQTKLKLKGLKPIVTVDQIKKTYEYNSILYLHCNVKGYPKPQTIWTDENGTSLRNTILKRNTLYDYSYHGIVKKLKKSQSYTCYAENKFGKNSINVFVNVDSPFVVTKHLEDVTNVAYDKEIELICDIKSKWPMKITWWKDGKLVTSHVSNDGTKLTIKKANIDNQGIHICEAKLLEDDLTLSYQTELKISGLILPYIEKETAFLIINKAEPVTLTCKITKGFPAPKRVWKFKEIGSDKWITMTNSEEHLTIERSQLRSGNYKCIASNVFGHDEMNIKLAVEVPPEIIQYERTVHAVELDLVLRIPCDTVGYPKPTVTWRVNGSTIEMGKRYNLDKNTLVILNPVTNDSGNYTCMVQNKFGSDNKITEAIVKSNDILFIINPNFEETTTSKPIPGKHIEKKDRNTKYILEGSIISIDCPHAKDDAVRWHKDNRYLNITGSPLVIKNATTKDDGIYNCRVCNYNGTQSYSYKINVGYAPRGDTESLIINKDGSLNQIFNKSLDCKFDVKPITNEIEWTFNGEMINENTTDFNGEINWGIYTCSITNPHGTAKRTFTVISNDCFLKKSQITKNAPLILTEDSSWPDIYYNEIYLRLPRNMNSKLFCRNQKNNIHFESFSKNNEILATCVGENKFSVNGTIVKFEDLQCNLPIQHIINATGATCLNENTELVKVGFEVDQFVEIYEVCVDKIAMVPLYTRIDMTPVYNVKSTQFATARLSEIDADKCGEGSKCCFGKTQLVSENDVRYGPSQAATFIEMNYVPYWRPCDGQLGWNDIEENITRKLEQIEGQFVIWSGASNYTKKSDVTIPRYLWKVVKIIDSEFSIVYVNDPNPTVEDKLCKDICNKFDWITSSESTYCCQLEEFRKVFQIPENLQ